MDGKLSLTGFCMPKTRFKPRTLVKLEETCVISSERSWICISLYSYSYNVFFFKEVILIMLDSIINLLIL